MAGDSEVTTAFRQLVAGDVSLHRQRRNAVTPPDQWEFLLIFEGCKLAERNRLPARQRHLQVAQTVQRDPLLVGRARHDIDQIDIVANLGDRRAR